jgi:hypothetical protein
MEGKEGNSSWVTNVIWSSAFPALRWNPRESNPDLL